jgi:hypothetical protein
MASLDDNGAISMNATFDSQQHEISFVHINNV